MFVGHAQQRVGVDRSRGIQDVVLRYYFIFQPSYLGLVVGFSFLIPLQAPVVVLPQPFEVLPRGLLRRELAPLLPQSFGLAPQARPLGVLGSPAGGQHGWLGFFLYG